MSQTELMLLNFEEIRRRSIKLWTGLPSEFYFWQPDRKAMHCLEMIRHVLEGEHLFHVIVKNRGNLGDYISPWHERPYTNVQDEIDFAMPFRAKFFDTINQFNSEEFNTVEIIRAEKNQRRKLGDYLFRIGYHEAVHTGQMLSYFRTMGIEIPSIWD
jgi:uncharacterized damage-inducible protein DinB